jgi:hypothetical protein
MTLVSDFRIEVFKQIIASNPPATIEPSHQYGCEV